jgi:hypothetical protein
VGAVHKVGRGDQTKFWTDVWLDRVPLKVSFYELFKISSDPEALVEELVEEGSWKVEFRRELNEQQLELWSTLQDKLLRVEVNGGNDIIVWAFEKDAQFTTSSLYKLLSFGGV